MGELEVFSFEEEFEVFSLEEFEVLSQEFEVLSFQFSAGSTTN